MKLTKTKLKQIIKEEISNITEDRQAHIEGIIKKIARLKKAVLNAEKGMENMTGGYDDHYDLLDVMSHPAYWAKQQEVMNLNDKIDVLKKQLDQLQQDSPGQLERG
jgi:polyhydroxyalkanoate synthesis regulator phasin|tara:strand:+ start:74 stop:391 length:318 start_codon:yes stop_codon:yes gene_type:complete